MGKCIAYTAGAITFLGIGALVTGLTLYIVYPNMRGGQQSTDEQMRYGMCDLRSADGLTQMGKIHFAQNSSESSTTITGTVAGLTAGAHGFHIHELGGTGDSCSDAGSHYNPADQSHGGPDSDERHVGDLGNIQSVGEGDTIAIVKIEDHQVSLSGKWSVMGRSVVVHALEDDLGASGDASGAAGARVACCTIYIINGA
uniref:Superoxide dismutase (Cu-Zn)-like n=1 Tax=Hirondellea gigas TaxID=1518452 RepID=A0A2P2I1S5_9CRUS